MKESKEIEEKTLSTRAFLCPHSLKHQADAENDSGNSEEVHSKINGKLEQKSHKYFAF